MPTMQLTGDPLRELAALLRQASELIRNDRDQNQAYLQSIIEQINTVLPMQHSSQLNLFEMMLASLTERTEEYATISDRMSEHLELVANQFDSVFEALRSGGLAGDTENPGAVLAEFQEIPLQFYLDTDSEAKAREVFAAIDNLANTIGIYNIEPAEIQRGSFTRRSKGVIASAFEDRSVQQRLQTVERLLELWQVDPRQADVDQRTSEALARVIESLNGVPRACIRFGSLLIVKYQDTSGDVLLRRQLSQPEIWAVEKYPELQTRPETILQTLTLAVTGQLESTVSAPGEA
jgi:hypothetical protein